jgi:inorganic pyrophosphatase
MTSSIRFLGQTLTIRIDRQMGSRHPKHGFIYPVNYGFLPGILSPDGEEMDAYLLGVFEAAAEFTGVCIAVIHRLDDDDDKLVIAPKGKTYTPDQIRALTEFQERYFVSEILT